MCLCGENWWHGPLRGCHLADWGSEAPQSLSFSSLLFVFAPLHSLNIASPSLVHPSVIYRGSTFSFKHTLSLCTQNIPLRTNPRGAVLKKPLPSAKHAASKCQSEDHCVLADPQQWQKSTSQQQQIKTTSALRATLEPSLRREEPKSRQHRGCATQELLECFMQIS